MKHYNIFANGRQLNKHPIGAENEEQLHAFIEIGLQYDLHAVTYEPTQPTGKAITPNDLTFRMSSSRSFKVMLQGVYVCTVMRYEGKNIYIGIDGVLDEVTNTPTEWFERIPNFNLKF